MRVLFLSQFFEPEPIGLKGLAFVHALASQGHDVEVLTGYPNYPEGRVYAGYRVRPYSMEKLDGINVHRVALYPSHDRSAVRRASNYLSFALSAAAVGPLLKFRPDIIYAYQSPGTIAVPAAILKAFKRSRLLCDIQDLWPDTVLASGMVAERLVKRPLEWLCRASYAVADGIVVPTTGMRRILTARGVAPDKVHVIYNWADESRAAVIPSRDEARRQLGWGDEFIVLFAGTMGVMQDMDTVLAAAQLLHASAPSVRIKLVGGGVEVPRLRDAIKMQSLDNVDVLPRVAPSEIGTYLGAADGLLVHLKRHELFESMIPSRTQTYMAARRPLIMAVSGDAADLVRQARCGVIAEPGNASSIASAIIQLAKLSPTERDQFAANGREYYDRELSVSCGLERFNTLFNQLAAMGRRATTEVPQL